MQTIAQASSPSTNAHRDWSSLFRNWEGADIGALTTPLEIEESPATRVFQRVTTVLGLLVIALIALAAVAPLHVTSTAIGQVAPEGEVIPLHHLEGGIVAAVTAKPGEVVEKGETLIRLSPIDAETEANQISSKRGHLTAQRLRYAALAAGAPPDFSPIAKNWPDFAADENTGYEQEREAFERSVSGLQSRLLQRETTSSALARQLSAARREKQLLSEQAELARRLLAEGFSSRADQLQSESAAINAEIEATRLDGDYAAAKEAALEAQHALDQLIAEKRAEWQNKVSDIDAQISDLNAISTRSADKLRRLEITAPARALVQDIKPNAPGEVIRPGDVVATLLPLGDEMVAEVRLRPEDIGHVKIGQDARVQVTSFDPGLYGHIAGRVLYVSPTTFVDDKGGAFFKAKISLGDRQLRRGRKAFDVLPGMTVQAVIVTDKRSVLSYLLKPVNRAFQNALTER